ncbi:hypothetical protein EJK55_1304 [Moraxella catarrhalis]|uniref:Uncharacterized protein n=1 Tax=Moraxella catarrhalis TaxID=480 RepID=A0ABY0BMQ8_MORCA|nr:hypothetical protein MCR_1046 [Moraxella catarrhalis BBH18]AZQ86765.1 hypothetical protein EJK52_1097 [Moraxella catarrhalis]AZQ89634.1 hypothetical protein EJK50_1150 [Moraxella catarrhalis]AZQ91580.1 hypothetical protein EJK51_1095 [Moraxella catarrhalis]RUO12883.1 hypothetical protein EJK55_1304 [Moraxella catarrhalis]
MDCLNQKITAALLRHIVLLLEISILVNINLVNIKQAKATASPVFVIKSTHKLLRAFFNWSVV